MIIVINKLDEAIEDFRQRLSEGDRWLYDFCVEQLRDSRNVKDLAERAMSFLSDGESLAMKGIEDEDQELVENTYSVFRQMWHSVWSYSNYKGG